MIATFRVAAAVALACALAAACQADAGERHRTFTAAGRADRSLAAGSTATLMRAPADSTRILYSRPTDLARPAPVPGVSAPGGGLTPDSGAAGAKPATAGGAPGTSARPRPAPSPPDTGRTR